MQTTTPPKDQRQLLLTCARENGRLVVRMRDDARIDTIKALHDSLTRLLQRQGALN